MKKWFLISFTSGEPLGGKYGSRTFVKFCSENNVFDFDKMPTLQIAFTEVKDHIGETPTPQQTLTHAKEFLWTVEELTPSGEKINRTDLVDAAFTEEVVNEFYEVMDNLPQIT